MVKGAVVVCVFDLNPCSLLPIKFGLFFFLIYFLQVSLIDGSKTKWQERKTGNSGNSVKEER